MACTAPYPGVNLCLAIDMSGSVCSPVFSNPTTCASCTSGLTDCQQTGFSVDTCCQNFENFITFANSVISTVITDTNSASQFSAVSFSESATTVISPLASDLASVQSDIEGITYAGGRTNHEAAIVSCQATFSGDTSGNENAILLITDGVSTTSTTGFDDEDDAIDAANTAAGLGTYIRSVFVNPAPATDDLTFMEALSTDNVVTTITDFDNLAPFINPIVAAIGCRGVTNAPTPPPTPKPTPPPTPKPTQPPTNSPTQPPTNSPTQPPTALVVLSGTVWEDLDGDGILESGAGEPFIAGATITVYDADTNLPVATVISDGNGDWSVSLPPGTYIAEIMPPTPPQYALSPKNNATDGNDFDPTTLRTDPIDLTSSGNSGEVDAGLFVPSTIQGMVFDDQNGDGIQDVGEGPIDRQASISLYEAGSTVPIQTITTQPDGTYVFEDVPPGSYEVEVDAGNNLIALSPQDAGANDNIDSDADPATGRTGPLTVQSGGVITHVDFGAIIFTRDDFAKTLPSTPVLIPVLDNDIPDEDTLTVVDSATTPMNGTVTIGQDGTVTYTPNPGFVGTDTFDYTICNSSGQCDTATVTVEVASLVTRDDEDKTLPDTPVTIPILDNDRESDGSFPNIVNNITDLPDNGSVMIKDDGTVVYTPDPGFSGVDVFTYEACDSLTGLCDEAQVVVTVGGPVARDDEDKTQLNTPVTIPILGDDNLSDGTTPTNVVSIITQPTNGAVEIQDDGTVVYTPDPGFTGRDPFTYKICEPGACGECAPSCDEAEVVVTVSGIIARDDEDETLPNTPVTIPVLDNDRESDGTFPNSIVSFTQPANGEVVINDDGTFTYTPNTDFLGRDPFTYVVCDPPPCGECDPEPCDEAQVTVTVSGPSAKDDEAKTLPDTPVTIPVLDDDKLCDGTTPTNVVSIATPPANGAVEIQDDGTVVYTPNPGFTGRDPFTYKICCPAPCGECEPSCDDAEVIVTVVGPGGPVARDDEDETLPNTPVTIPILDDDKLSDGTTPTNVVSITIPPTNGAVEIQDDGTVVYTPDPGFTGRDPFTYKICEPGACGECDPVCDEAQVTVTVTPPPSCPVLYQQCTLGLECCDGTVCTQVDASGSSLCLACDCTEACLAQFSTCDPISQENQCCDGLTCKQIDVDGIGSCMEDIDQCNNPAPTPPSICPGQYWADYTTNTCKCDCPVGSGLGCMPAPPPIAMFDSIEMCCAAGLFWIDPLYCNSRSTDTLSGGWVADWDSGTCVKDCDPALGHPCQDIAFSDEIYATVMDCCGRIGWNSNCVAESQ